MQTILKASYITSLKSTLPLASFQYRLFTGKTESGFKFKTPKLRMKRVNPIFPAPGLDLKAPENMTPEIFCK